MRKFYCHHSTIGFQQFNTDVYIFQLYVLGVTPLILRYSETSLHIFRIWHYMNAHEFYFFFVNIKIIFLHYVACAVILNKHRASSLKCHDLEWTFKTISQLACLFATALRFYIRETSRGALGENSRQINRNPNTCVHCDAL